MRPETFWCYARRRRVNGQEADRTSRRRPRRIEEKTVLFSIPSATRSVKSLFFTPASGEVPVKSGWRVVMLSDIVFAERIGCNEPLLVATVCRMFKYKKNEPINTLLSWIVSPEHPLAEYLLDTEEKRRAHNSWIQGRREQLNSEEM